jgi:hypothetical protein
VISVSAELDEVAVYARITKACREAGGQRAFAERAGCSEQMISLVLNARRPASDRILRAAGLKRVVKFIEIPAI